MIEYKAVPDDDRFVGWFRVNQGRSRVCGHRHYNEAAAEKCAGTLARRVARETK